jgi:hypothetical protein
MPSRTVWGAAPSMPFRSNRGRRRWGVAAFYQHEASPMLIDDLEAQVLIDAWNCR